MSFPSNVVKRLEEELGVLVKQELASKTLAQRIDVAEAKLRKAVVRCEKAVEVVHAANGTRELARKE
eukprot:5281696-Lingulodinium_polyedra.AAC.1